MIFNKEFYSNDPKMIRKWSENDPKMSGSWSENDPKMIRKWANKNHLLTNESTFILVQNERTDKQTAKPFIAETSTSIGRAAAVLFNYFHVPSIIEWPTEFLWYSTTVLWYRMYDVYKNVVQKYLLCSSLHGTTTYTVYSISIAPSFTTVREG